MPRKQGATEPQVRASFAARAAGDGPPQCPQQCGFVGWPTATETPYTNCRGDIAAHTRQPVGAGRG